MSMASTTSSNRFHWLPFRVLIIGRANAGKTTILQRVCDTTDSPKVYRNGKKIQLESSTERGTHNIDDELIFSNHDGYIFHDSRGFESGGEEELKMVQHFVREKATQRRLRNRLHAIWYCIPMDGDRPFLDLKYFNDICPDKNVPIIAVFTKYDQFKVEMEFKLEDSGWENPGHSIGKLGGRRFCQTEFIIHQQN